MIEVSGDYIKSLSVLLMKNFTEDMLSSFATTHAGIAPTDKVGVFASGDFEKVGLGGCEPEYSEESVLTEQDWTGNEFSLNEKFCAKNLSVELRRYQELYNLDENEAFQKWIGEYAQETLSSSIIARALFGSTSATTDYAGGIKGLDGVQGYINRFDEMVANGDADATQKVSFTNTKAALRTNGLVFDVIEDVIDAADMKVKSAKDAVIIVSQSIFDDMSYCARIDKNIYNFAGNFDITWNGLKTSTYNGYTLVVVPTIDLVLSKMQNGDKFYGKRGVVIMTTISNLRAGSISSKEAGLGDINCFYEKKDKNQYLTIDYSLYTAVADPKMFAYAY